MEGKINIGSLLPVSEARRLDELAARTRDSRASVMRRAIAELCDRELGAEPAGEPAEVAA